MNLNVREHIEWSEEGQTRGEKRKDVEEKEKMGRGGGGRRKEERRGKRKRRELEGNFSFQRLILCI